MPQSVPELLDLLDLEEIEVGLFRARQPSTTLQRVFGGQVLAQALVAAARTVVVHRVLHSLHSYFLVAGRTDLPIVYDVETVRDGGSFSSRRVVARQGGKVIFYLSASFHELEAGFDHLDPFPRASRSRDGCPTLSEVLAAASGRSPSVWDHEWGSLEVRYAGTRARGERWSTRGTRPGPGSGCGRTACCPTTAVCTRPPWPTRATSPCWG